MPDEPDGLPALLEWVATLRVPELGYVTDGLGRLATAIAEFEEVRRTDAGRARGMADLLERALTHHAAHGDGPCPVCGEGALDASWQRGAQEQAELLRQEAASADVAAQQLRLATSDTRSLFQAPPARLKALRAAGFETSALETAWDEWARGGSIDDPRAYEPHVALTHAPLQSALSEAQARARVEIASRDDAWKPLAEDLAAWLSAVDEAGDVDEHAARLKEAGTWLKAAIHDIRNARLAPIKEGAAKVWQELRQESNVELGPIELVGSRTSRRVSLDVTVDGVGSPGVAVMSQGELHALGLALFLPRATLAESPFRFLVIDDPVQAMDPAKVDGLARVLDDVARTRQVVVFTHDDRLGEAVRRLRINARILEVVRREGSVVEVKSLADPVMRYLQDARALARSDGVPEGVVERVVPGLCRLAVEAACQEAFRRGQISAGKPHASVEEDLRGATTTTQIAALALFGDIERSGDVMTRLNAFGAWAGTCFKTVKGAGHDAYGGDLGRLVADTERLAEKLRA